MKDKIRRKSAEYLFGLLEGHDELTEDQRERLEDARNDWDNDNTREAVDTLLQIKEELESGQ
jgi:hypothetical protein